MKCSAIVTLRRVAPATVSKSRGVSTGMAENPVLLRCSWHIWTTSTEGFTSQLCNRSATSPISIGAVPELLTLIRTGMSALSTGATSRCNAKQQRNRSHLPQSLVNASATCKAAEDDCLERRKLDQTARPITRSLQGRAGRQRTVLEPLDNVPTLARAAPKPRGNGVSASIRRRRTWAWSYGQNIQMLVVTLRDPKMLRGSSCSECRG
jgi:hypothetical protein